MSVRSTALIPVRQKKNAPPEGQNYHDLPFRMSKIITSWAPLISFHFCGSQSEDICSIRLMNETRNTDSSKVNDMQSYRESEQMICQAQTLTKAKCFLVQIYMYIYTHIHARTQAHRHAHGTKYKNESNYFTTRFFKLWSFMPGKTSLDLFLRLLLFCSDLLHSVVINKYEVLSNTYVVGTKVQVIGFLQDFSTVTFQFQTWL